MKKIIILGASGYVGQRLVKKLLDDTEDTYDLHLFSRNKRKLSHFLDQSKQLDSIVSLYDIALEHDNFSDLSKIFSGTHTVYHLIHSMSEEDDSDFMKQELNLAKLISNLSSFSNIKQIIYLGGLGNSDNEELSIHLRSRQETGRILRDGGTPVTEFRAGVIIGAGGSSFEIIRTLATKLPFIPVFFKKEGLCETIFIDNVIQYLKKCLYISSFSGKILEIGNGTKKTYSELVQDYANNVLGKNLIIINLSFLSFFIRPNLIGRVIAFMTGHPKELIIPLIYGVKNDAIVTDKFKLENVVGKCDLLNRIVPLDLSFQLAADREHKGKVISVWDMPSNLSNLEKNIRSVFSTQETEGLLYEERYIIIDKNKSDLFFNEILQIGSSNSGYWSPYFMWKIRGIIDKLFGGPGVGNNLAINRSDIHIGDRIDFWSVENIISKTKVKELRLRAEMKTPGEAWLQFKILPSVECKNKSVVHLRAFFEPKGIPGYIYWYSLYFIHKFIFSMMLNNISSNVDSSK
jgi:uncharacterized protein YbjT (DUF2867 family)